VLDARIEGKIYEGLELHVCFWTGWWSDDLRKI